MLMCTARCRAGFSMVCNAASMVFSSQMVRSSMLTLGASRGEIAKSWAISSTR